MMGPAQVMMVAAVCVGLAAPLLLWAFTADPDADRRRTLANLSRDLPGSAATGSGGAAVQRGGLAGLAWRMSPAAAVRFLDGLLAQAGRPAAWPLERVLVTKTVLAAATGAVAVLVVGGAPSLRAVLFCGFVVLFVWALPDLLLWNTGIKRRQLIQESLPDTLDQLTIAVEAGLGFESALAHVAHNSAGPLAQEFARTLQDIQVGQPRRAAYTALIERTNVQDLRRFVRSLIQADAHGVSIARVLATQAAEMRIRRRQRAEEKAMQIPVKVIFPLVLFILPALFIVILGPAAINIMEAFSG